MTKQEYEQYLKSDKWFNFSQRIKRQRRRCEGCGIEARDALARDRQGLNVHHKTYDRIGGELPGDVELLCYVCHMGKHGKVGWLKFCSSKAMPRTVNADYLRCISCGKCSRIRIYDMDEITDWLCAECRA